MKIADGEFGDVFLGKVGRKKVAIKVPKLSDIQDLKSSLEEIKISAYLGAHENVCQFLGACTNDIPQGWPKNGIMNGNNGG